MTYIKNRDQLLSHGRTGLRRKALEIIEYALAQADPYRATRARVHLNGDLLTVDGAVFELGHRPRIFIMGAGKASFPIAAALEDILGERISDGLVICKYGQQGRLAHCRLHLAAHPIPDEAGLAGARDMMALAERAQPGDIVFGCITGGSSALLPYPVAGISLGEKKVVNRRLLTCGANIVEINAVRKHLSRIKGGRLAMAIHPRAHLINLTVSDVIGDALDYITDPTVADTSTLADARATLNKYDLWSRLPASVTSYLKQAGPEAETPKAADFAGRSCRDIILVPGDAACTAAAAKAADLGLETMVLSTMLEGESRELGRTFSAIAKEIRLNGRPVKAPCAVIGGGETTVKFDGDGGHGGPNQEFALGAAFDLSGMDGALVAGIDSDGTDGPTEIAGAIVDDQTMARAAAVDLDPFAHLERHDVTPFFKTLEDAIQTGATGTNVNDLKLMLLVPQGG